MFSNSKMRLFGNTPHRTKAVVFRSSHQIYLDLSVLCIFRSTSCVPINAEHNSDRVSYRYRMNNFVAHRTSYSATVVVQLKRDGTRVEIRFRLSAKRTSPFKWVGESVQLTTGRRGACISGQ
jgi:hypothetical protein